MKNGDGRAARIVASAEDTLAFASFVALGVVVFLQFFTRYALNSPLGWTEEIARYLLTVSAYFGCVVALRRNSHIRLELAEKRLPPHVAAIVRKIILAVSAVIFVYLAWVTLDLTLRTRRMMVSLPSVPIKAVYWPVFVCFVVMAARSAIMLLPGRNK